MHPLLSGGRQLALETLMKYQTRSKRCLGIDPGLANCGWLVVQRSQSKYRLIASGCLHTPKTETLGSRLADRQQYQEP